PGIPTLPSNKKDPTRVRYSVLLSILQENLGFPFDREKIRSFGLPKGPRSSEFHFPEKTIGATRLHDPTQPDSRSAPLRECAHSRLGATRHRESSSPYLFVCVESTIQISQEADDQSLPCYFESQARR